jgi:hypothetical protein
VQTIALMAVAALIWIPEALAVSVVCAWAIAVMVTILFGVGCVAGAVYRPFLSMVPSVELPPATGVPVPMLTSHLTSVLLKLVIVAVHCTVPFTVTEVAAQEAVIVGVGGGVLEPPPQEVRTRSAVRSAKTRRRPCHRAFERHRVPFGGSTRNPPGLTVAGLPDRGTHASD